MKSTASGETVRNFTNTVETDFKTGIAQLCNKQSTGQVVASATAIGLAKVRRDSGGGQAFQASMHFVAAGRGPSRAGGPAELRLAKATGRPGRRQAPALCSQVPPFSAPAPLCCPAPAAAPAGCGPSCRLGFH